MEGGGEGWGEGRSNRSRIAGGGMSLLEAVESWVAKSLRELDSSVRWFLPLDIGMSFVLQRDRQEKGPMFSSVALKAMCPLDLGKSGYWEHTHGGGFLAEKEEA